MLPHGTAPAAAKHPPRQANGTAEGSGPQDRRSRVFPARRPPGARSPQSGGAAGASCAPPPPAEAARPGPGLPGSPGPGLVSRCRPPMLLPPLPLAGISAASAGAGVTALLPVSSPPPHGGFLPFHS